MDGLVSSKACSRWYFFMVLCSQITGLTVVSLIAILFAQYRGGFEWKVRERFLLFEYLENKYWYLVRSFESI